VNFPFAPVKRYIPKRYVTPIPTAICKGI
jgi:hypothetical protein